MSVARPFSPHTAAGIANERKRGTSWEQIAKRYLFRSAEEARSTYYSWRWAATHGSEKVRVVG